MMKSYFERFFHPHPQFQFELSVLFVFTICTKLYRIYQLEQHNVDSEYKALPLSTTFRTLIVQRKITNGQHKYVQYKQDSYSYTVYWYIQMVVKKVYLPNSTLCAIPSSAQLYIPRWHFKFNITKLIDIHYVWKSLIRLIYEFIEIYLKFNG